MTNALAYYSMELISSVKCFIVQDSGLNVVKLSTVIFYECLTLASLSSLVSCLWVRPGAYPWVEHWKVLHSEKLRSYKEKLSWLGLPETNTLVYYKNTYIKAVNFL